MIDEFQLPILTPDLFAMDRDELEAYAFNLDMLARRLIGDMSAIDHQLINWQYKFNGPSLSNKERDIVSFLVSRRGKVVRRSNLIDLYFSESDSAANGVSVYLNRFKKKFAKFDFEVLTKFQVGIFISEEHCDAIINGDFPERRI